MPGQTDLGSAEQTTSHRKTPSRRSTVHYVYLTIAVIVAVCASIFYGALPSRLLSVADWRVFEPTIDGPTVTVVNGTYAGLHNHEYNQDFFLGMPYAKVIFFSHYAAS